MNIYFFLIEKLMSNETITSVYNTIIQECPQSTKPLRFEEPSDTYLLATSYFGINTFFKFKY